MKQHKGYTLVEFVAILVIIGVLSAIAVPVYVQFARIARLISLNYLVGSVYSAVNLVKAGYYVTGNISPVVMANGNTVTVTTTAGLNNGAPLATALGIGNAITVFGYALTYSTSPNLAIFTIAPNCTAIYSESTGVATLGTTTGC